LLSRGLNDHCALRLIVVAGAVGRHPGRGELDTRGEHGGLIAGRGGRPTPVVVERLDLGRLFVVAARLGLFSGPAAGLGLVLGVVFSGPAAGLGLVLGVVGFVGRGLTLRLGVDRGDGRLRSGGRRDPGLRFVGAALGRRRYARGGVLVAGRVGRPEAGGGGVILGVVRRG